MKNIIVIIVTSLVLFGCTKYIEFDGETTRPKIVVNGFVSSNSPAIVHISKSLSVIDNARLTAIDNAEVNLYTGQGDFIETLELITDSTIYFSGQAGYYRGTTALSSNQDYVLKVSAASYESVTATTNIPQYNITQSSPPDTLSVMDIDYEGVRTTFTFHLVDNGLEQNYYGIKVYGYAEGGDMNEIYDLQTDDIIADKTYGAEILFTDNFFSGSTHNLPIKLSPYYYNDSNYNQIKYDSIAFVFSSYSRDFYLYKKSYASYQNVDEFFSQPVQVYSNIENGLGVFGGVKEDSFVVELN